MGVRANVTRYGGNPHAPVQHPLARSDALARHGAAPLDTLFECPHVVKLTLCDLAGLNRTLLVESEAAVEEVFGASDCRLVFTPQNRHQKTVSRCAPRLHALRGACRGLQSPLVLPHVHRAAGGAVE